MKKIWLLVIACVAACGLFPASPYFTDLHGCKDSLGQAHYFVEPQIDGFYTIEVWQMGIIGTINEGGAIEVLGDNPPRIQWITSTIPAQILWKARGGDQWQPASRQQTEMPSVRCNFV